MPILDQDTASHSEERRAKDSEFLVLVRECMEAQRQQIIMCLLRHFSGLSDREGAELEIALRQILLRGGP